MKEVLTEQLLDELLSKPNIQEALKNENLNNKNLTDYLNELLNKHNLKKKEIINNCDVNDTHLYQIFQGTRKGSRNKILQIAFAMHLNLKETNRLLYYAGVSTLYCKNRRDAIIIYSIENQYSLFEIENVLYEYGEKTLNE